MVSEKDLSKVVMDLKVSHAEQSMRVKTLREKLKLTYTEMRVFGFSSTMRECRKLEHLLHLKTQVIEETLTRLGETEKLLGNSKLVALLMHRVFDAFNTIDRSIPSAMNIPLTAKREGIYQERLRRGYEILLPNHALLEHMIATVSNDLVAHASMDLVTRLHEVNMIVPQLPKGNRRKVLIDYRVALKNIGVFVRAVKTVHKIFCTVYPDQGM